MKRQKSILLLTFFMFFTATIQAQDIVTAVRAGDLNKVKELVEKDPQLLNLKDENGRTPFHWAVANGNIEMAIYLLQKGSNVNNRTNSLSTPLHAAASVNNLKMVAWLLENGADVKAKNSSGITPLHWAAQAGSKEIVEFLLNKGAELDARDENGDTPLNKAVSQGFKETIEFLLDRKADYDTSGTKILYITQKSAERGLARLFKDAVEKGGVSLFNNEATNMETMRKAVEGGSVEIVDILFAKKIPVNLQEDIYGWTPLHYAANNNNLAMIEWLIKKEIDVNKRDKSGISAYNIAEIKGYKEALTLIIKSGGNPEPRKFPVITGPYLGQKLPGMTPEIFAPGIISSADFKDFSIAFSPDGNEIYFYRLYDNVSGPDTKIFCCKVENGKWTAPEEVSFTAGYEAFLPYVTRDNKQLYFLWITPTPAGDSNEPAMWVTERTKNGWSEPKYAGKGMYVTSTRDGRFFTGASSSVDGFYIAQITVKDGVFTDYEKVPIPSHLGGQWHPSVAPDGSYFLFDQEGDHMSVSFKKVDGTWGEAIDLWEHGFDPIAGAAYISPDGKYLFFKQGYGSNRDIWWVDIKAIENLRPKEIKE